MALEWLNPVGHFALISLFVGSFVATCVLFSDRIFTIENAHIFIPYFEKTYQMWTVIGLNSAALIWATIISLM
jgi:hypothetical protein